MGRLIVDTSHDVDALLDLTAAGIDEAVHVGVEMRDGFGSGGSTAALAVTEPIEDVIARLTDAHGPPELGTDGPPSLHGHRWSRSYQDERNFRGAMIIVVDGVANRPNYVAADRVPADATGFLLVDQAYGSRTQPAAAQPAAVPDEPATKRRLGVTGRLRQLLSRR